MTVCIAALCESGKTAILVADRKLSMEYVEADVGIKINVVARKWLALLAGDDLGAAHEIAEVCGEELQGQAVTPTQVRDSLSRAYQNVKLRRAEAQYLRSRGWTLEEFKNRGLSLLPESTFIGIDGAITRYDLGVDILACGFSKDTADIIHVTSNGVSSFETELNFATIGTGATIASSQLYVRKYTKFMDLPQALYYVYEAKIAAESASGVGVPTFIILMRHDRDKVVVLEEKALQGLRSIYDELKARDLQGKHVHAITLLPTVQDWMGVLELPAPGAPAAPPPPPPPSLTPHG